eukprot:jgi/Mesen1/2698/ME000167S01843
MQQEQHWQGSSEVHADGQHVVSEQGSARPSLSGSELLSLLQGSRSRSMPRPQSSSDTQTHAKPADATSLENHNSEQDSQYGAFAFGTGQPLEAGKEGAGRGAVAHGPIGPPSKQPQTQAAAAAAASWLGDSPSAHSFGPLFGVPQQLHAGHPPGFPDARDRIFNPGTAPLPPGPLAASSSSPGPGPGPAGLLGLGAVGGLSQDPDTDQGGALSSSVNGSASRASATGANQRGLQDAIMARQLDPPPLEPPPPAFASSSDQIFSGRPKGGRGGNASSLGPPGPAAHHLQEQQSPVSGRAVGRPARASSSSGAPPGPAVAPAASDGRPLAGAPRRNSGGTDPLLMKRQGGATAAKPASGDQRAPASDRSAAVPGEGGHSGPASLAELAEPRGAGMWAPGGPLAPNWGEEGLPTDQAGGTMGGQNGGGPLLRDEGKGHGNGSASQGHEGSSKWTPRPMEVPAWLLTQPEAAGQHDSEHGQHNAGAGLVLAQNGQPHARAQASGEGRSLEVSLAEELQVPPLASQIDRPVTVDALSSEPGDAILQAKRQVAALQEQQELLSAAELGELSLGGERGEQQQQQQHGAGNGGTSIWDPVDHAAAGKRSSGGDSWPQRGGLSRAVNGFMGGQVAVAQQLEERRPEAGGPSDRAENAREAAESQLVVQPGGIQKDSRSRLISSESPVGSSSPAAFSYPSTSPTMMRMGSFQGRQSLDGGGRARGEMELITRSLVALCDSLIPTAGEEMRRRLFLARLDQLVARSWAHAKLFLFGSCANAFGVRDSDIDVCLSVDDPQASKANLIARMANILRSDGMQNVQALTHARVPVVKFMDAGTGISCDICVNNMLAVANTKLLHDYAQVDRRLRQLAYLVKHWAKQRQINETYRGTLSSYAYVLMCIFFLQQRRPPILPVLQEMDPTCVKQVGDTVCAHYDRVDQLQEFGARNTETVGELLGAFFEYWAFRHDYNRAVISVRLGAYLSKDQKDWTRRVGNERHLICIEDPFEITHDLGRVVDRNSIRVLKEEFHRAAKIMRHDPDPASALFDPYIRNER